MKLANLLARSVLVLELTACGVQASSTEAAGGVGTEGAGAAAGSRFGEPLGDLLPIAVRLDCSKLAGGEPPSSIYVSIAEPISKEPTLTARLDGDICSAHDSTLDPSAPAVTLRCPPRRLIQSDGYPAACSHHYIELVLCSPGFEEQQVTLEDLSSCPTQERERPICESVQRGDVAAYAYERVVYQLVPKADGGTDCPSFDEPPSNSLAEDPLYACPCSEAASSPEE